MRVTVIGPGALGCLFAARFAEAGMDAVLVDHSPDRAKALSSGGIRIAGGGGERTAQVPVRSDCPADSDLYMVLVKSHQTASVDLPAERLVLTVQNGLGNVERLCEAVGSRNVLAGSTSEAAIREEDGYVRHVASGKTVFGPWTSADPEPARLALERAGFDAEITPAPGQAIWEKATLNSGINPLTALLNMPNGALVEVPEVRQLMRDLVVEAVKVATLEGYRFEYSLVEAAEDLCRATADNISSMLQDVRAGRKTEIDALSGELLRRGQASGLPMPRTRVVYQLIRGLEERQAAD